jgi:hypothetical protein
MRMTGCQGVLSRVRVYEFYLRTHSLSRLAVVKLLPVLQFVIYRKN